MLRDAQLCGLNHSYSMTAHVETLGPVQELFTKWFAKEFFFLYMLKRIVLDVTTGTGCTQLPNMRLHIFLYLTMDSIYIVKKKKEENCMYFAFTLMSIFLSVFNCFLLTILNQ